MKIKIIQNKEIRVWKYPSSHKYSSLIRFIAKTFGYLNASSYSLQYQDDEGDNINITNDNDIDDALLFAKEECRKSLKIYLISSNAMDHFLDDALSDLFGASPSKPIKKKQPKRIKSKYKNKQKQKQYLNPINSNPNQYDPIRSPSNTLSPKEMLNIIPNNPLNIKPMNPEDILASMFEEDIVSSQSQVSIHSKPQIMSANDVLKSMDIHIEPSKQSIHNDIHNDDESPEDILQNLLDDNDIPMPMMDPHDVINSIINKPNDDDNIKVSSSESAHEEEEIVEESVSDLKLNNNSNGTEPLQPPEILYPKKGVNPSDSVPTIQTKVPPAPFLQRHHSPINKMNYGMNGVNEEYKVNIANGHQEIQRENDNNDEDDTLDLLAQFNALPDAPHHVVSSTRNIECDADNDEEEEEIAQEPDAKTLEEIRQSLEHPMSFHDTNLSQIQEDMQREKLPDHIESENEDENENEDIDETEDVNSDNDDDEDDDMEIEPIDDEGDEVNIKNEDDIENGESDQIENENEDQIENVDDDDDNNDNGGKYQNEIDKLYAELDDIDMDFEIKRLNEEDAVIKEQTEDKDDIQSPINDDNTVENKDDVQSPIEINPMDDNTNINEDNAVDTMNDAQKVESEETESDDDDDDMDLTRTTPDPLPTKQEIEVHDANDDNMDISDEREPESCDLEHNTECIQQNTDIEHVQNIKNEENTESVDVENKENIEQNDDKEEVSDNIDIEENEENKEDKDLNMNDSSSTNLSNITSPRDQRREIGRILREEQREKEKKSKLESKQSRIQQKQKEQQLRKQQKEEEKRKRLQQKEITKNSKKWDKLRRVRSRELNQFRSISMKQNEIFTPNKTWFPIKFILDTTKIKFEFETVCDLQQIIELSTVKQYRVYPSYIECVFNNDNIHNNLLLPSNKDCIVYIYYNWRSIQNVSFQSINLGICDEYIVKVNVFRMSPWINIKENESSDMNIDPNIIYTKHLESEIMKHKLITTKSKQSPLKKLFNKKKEEDKDKDKDGAIFVALLPDNCHQTPNFRWKFDLTQDYAAFDPLLNDSILQNTMHPFEIYFVKIRSDAVCNDAPNRVYDIYVVYLACCNENEIHNLLCNISSNKKENNRISQTEVLLLQYLEDEKHIVNEIMTFLRYNRCYGFVTVSKNTTNHSEQITFHYGSIADWIKCAIVGETDFEDNMLNLQKYGKWNNKQHLSLCSFLNSIITSYSM